MMSRSGPRAAGTPARGDGAVEAPPLRLVMAATALGMIAGALIAPASPSMTASTPAGEAAVAAVAPAPPVVP